jgi:hypothetical protein
MTATGQGVTGLLAILMVLPHSLPEGAAFIAFLSCNVPTDHDQHPSFIEKVSR